MKHEAIMTVMMVIMSSGTFFFLFWHLKHTVNKEEQIEIFTNSYHFSISATCYLGLATLPLNFLKIKSQDVR